MRAAGRPAPRPAAAARHRLTGIGLALERLLVCGPPAAAGAAACLALTGRPGGWAGLAAAFAAGALVHPLRDRLRRAADRPPRRRRDPRLLADRISRSVQEAPGPAEALVTALATVREALRVPGAAAEVSGDEIRVSGELGEQPYDLPLVWHGERVGRMLVARPEGGRHLDARLLGMLAVHLADVAHAVRLTADLQRSRERILTAREEERRRLRRDLHDGLGPTLASLAMSLDAARLTLTTSPERVEPLLAELRGRMAVAIGDIRELVSELRPPALDDLGLEGAIRSWADGCCERVDVRMETGADGEVGDLPAAVEVAAYRIVQEALANVRLHSSSPSAQVRLSRGADLRITVSDAGVGLPDRLTGGTGLRAMREHAAELGGTCTVRPRPGGGTVVVARLPLVPVEPESRRGHPDADRPPRSGGAGAAPARGDGDPLRGGAVDP
ncbi:two-component sensor histidine kinase [Actinomadura craniellae]|uniref:histidine kinase n=1 Tax=Actinomadura craniellae TaxID=2231787 RepID=A0A365GV77_9ACTN|nr:sensor histidine kinase [Actinomadura craniellae]RAY10699.1 two-component sensor histidine kinase [Actinomadura craniellae]